MRFYSRLVFICNVCFIIAMVLWNVEMKRRLSGNFNAAIGFQPLEATLVILGYGAIFLNFFFILLYIYRLLRRRVKLVPAWIGVFNIIMFPVQIHFHFFLH